MGKRRSQIQREKPNDQYWLNPAKQGGGFIPVYDELLTCPAYKRLSHSAKWIYIAMCSNNSRQYGGKGKHNYEHRPTLGKGWTFTRGEACKRYGVTHTVFARAVKQLQAYGFISLVVDGHKDKTESVYSFSPRYIEMTEDDLDTIEKRIKEK